MEVTDDDVRKALKPLVFGWHHAGIRRTGDAYPLGAFFLIASTIDVLAGFAYNPDRDDDRGRGARYRRFVQDFFPPQYTGLRDALWDGLRSSPLHYFNTTRVLFTDGQPEHHLHLTRDVHDRVILHWPEFLADYEAARDKYWAGLATDRELMGRAKARLERRPPMSIVVVERPMQLPTVLPAQFVSGATAMANPPVASGGVADLGTTSEGATPAASSRQDRE
jgi:hypothetical protein